MRWCAGALVAREHAAARQVRPELPAGFDSAEVCAAALQRLCDSGHHGLVATGNGRIELALCTAAWSCPAANANGGRSTRSGSSAKKHLPAVRQHACTSAARRSDPDEPRWFYDVYGAIRGTSRPERRRAAPGRPGAGSDRPVLRGPRRARLCRPSQKQAEIDIIALADGWLIIGEANAFPPSAATRKPARQPRN